MSDADDVITSFDDPALDGDDMPDIETVKVDMVTEYERTGRIDIAEWVTRHPGHRGELIDFWMWLKGTRDVGLEWALTCAISALENWGRHHRWCTVTGFGAPTAAECNCGYEAQLTALRIAAKTGGQEP